MGYEMICRGIGVRLPGGVIQLPTHGVQTSPSPRVKRQGREADHPPPTSGEVKKMWIYTSTPPYAFMA
jgi:hypothetical protein